MNSRRKLLLLAFVVALPCGGGCFSFKPGGNFTFDGGGPSGCGGGEPETCGRVDQVVAHGHIAQRWWLGGCFVWCDDVGWNDCDGELDDGCETQGPCPVPPTPPDEPWSMQLPAAADSIAVCDDTVYLMGAGFVAKVDPNTKNLLPLTTTVNASGGLACDANDVYWGQAGGIVRSTNVPLVFDGGAILASGAPGRGLLLESGRLYWPNADAGAWTLSRTALDGATAPVAPVASSTVDLPFAVRDDATYVVQDGRLATVDGDGGSTTVGDASAVAVAASDGGVAVVSGDGASVADLVDGGLGAPRTLGAVRAIVANGSDVYVATDTTLAHFTFGSATIETLASGQGTIDGIAVDAAFVYWITRDDTSLHRVPR